MKPVFSFRIFLFLNFFLSFCLIGGGEAQAQDAKNIKDPYRSTNLPIPRFASIADEKSFVRTGPGKQYPVKWVIEKPGIPVEIILEYDAWRKIKDFQGQEGWVYRTLLSGSRAGVIIGNETVSLYNSEVINSNSSSIIANLEPSVIVKIKECRAASCYIDAQGYKGWIARKSLWGVYADENFD